MDKLKVFSFLCLFTFICVLLNKYYLLPPLSPDSWSYYEISKTIFSDFYRFTTYRSYENSSEYGSSFPPLWPFLIAVFNAIFDMGPRAGLLINLILLPFILLSVERLARVFSSVKYLGFLAFFICLSDESFMDEVIAGRSIPLQVLLLLNLSRLLVLKERVSKCGLLLGLCLMNRFDALVLLPFVILYLIFSDLRLRKILGFLSCFILTICPWIIYSCFRFSSFWKTDNSFVAKAVHKAYVTDWYPSEIVTLREDFYGWLGRVSSNFYPLFHAYWRGVWGLKFAILGTALVLVFAFFIIKFALKNSKVTATEINWKILLNALYLFIGFRVFSSVPYLLTGYLDLRYFSFLRMVLMLLLLIGLVLIFKNRCNLQNLINLSLSCLLPILVGLGIYELPVVSRSMELDPLNPVWIAKLDACLKKDEKSQVTFFPGIYNPFQFGAISGNKSACLPDNFERLSVVDRAKFLKTFHVSHVVSSKDRDLLSSELGVKLERVECEEPLYKISEFL